MKKIVKIGTRSSDLAIKQVRLVVDKLRPLYPDTSFILMPMDTTGDIRRETNKSVEDKKQWIIELEQKLCNGDIDFAVHSAKDVPIQLEPNTEVTSVLERSSCFDVMLYNSSQNLSLDTPLPMLPAGAVVGTSSKRRKSQLLKLRPDLEIRLCRGNVPTRISKLRDKKEFDAIVLASAGLSRLNIDTYPFTYEFTKDEMLPAVAQGTLVAQCCSDATEILAMLKGITHNNTQIAFEAERSCIDELGADCHSSVGVYAEILENRITLSARVLSEDGLQFMEDNISGKLEEGVNIGKRLGHTLLEKGACNLL